MIYGLFEYNNMFQTYAYKITEYILLRAIMLLQK